MTQLFEGGFRHGERLYPIEQHKHIIEIKMNTSQNKQTLFTRPKTHLRIDCKSMRIALQVFPKVPLRSPHSLLPDTKKAKPPE